MAKLYASKITAVFTSIILFAAAHAQKFQLLKDINAQTHSIPSNMVNNSTEFAVLNDKAYFSADDGIHGREFWCSDGTFFGTTLVKDINPGPAGSYVSNIFVYKNKLFFFTTTDYITSKLYTSDGTAAGTVILKDGFGVAGFDVNPASYMVLNDILYFTASNGYVNEELWRTDGTTAGTKMLINFNTPEQGYKHDIHNFTLFNNRLFFTAGQFPQELWYTDGSAAGTQKFSDGFASIDKLSVLNGTLYMLANKSLWLTNGDSASLQRIDAYNGLYSISDMQVFKGKVYCAAQSTVLATKGIYTYSAPAQDGLAPYRLFDAVPRFAQALQNGLLFFTLTDSASQSPGLWVTDGIPPNTKLLSQGKGGYSNFYADANWLYFSHADSLTGDEPWISNGTAAGTTRLDDINAGIFDSKPSNFTQVGLYVFFSANSSGTGIELYRTNISNTMFVKDINATSTSNGSPMFIDQGDTINNELLFWADDGVHGFEPWATDGTNGGTRLLKDILPGSSSSNAVTAIILPEGLQYSGMILPVNNRLNGYDYFYGVSPANGWALYKTQGTPGSTGFASNIVTSATGIEPQSIAAFNNKIFTVVNAEGSSQLFAYDGVSDPVLLKTGFKIAVSQGGGRNTMGVGAYLYFFVDLQPGLELWKTDGTVTGTKAVKTLYPGQLYSPTTSYTASYKNQLFFIANSSYSNVNPPDFDNNTNYLWKTNGTAGGTTMVKKVSVTRAAMVVANNKLFFVAHEDATGEELWVTDGTAAGSHIVKDISAGPNNASVNNLINFKEALYFIANDGNKYGIWKSDGTDTGTVFITKADVSLVEGDGNLYFVYKDKIWQSDGTAAGSKLMDTTSLQGLMPLNLSYANGKLYFVASTYAYGTELYTTTEKLLPVSLLYFTGSLKGNDAQLQWATANELHNNYFNVQRSTNGAGFTTIGKVYANNGAAKSNYGFVDANVTALGANKLYYRLQQVDLDGKYEYSQTVQIDVPKTGLLKVWPNPAATFTSIYASAAMPNAVIQVVDAAGRLLRTSKHNIPAGGSVNIPLQGYAKGVYTITVQQPGMRKQEYKVVVE